MAKKSKPNPTRDLLDGLEAKIEKEFQIRTGEAVLDLAVNRQLNLDYVEFAKSLGMFSGSRQFSELLRHLTFKDMREGKPPRTAVIKGVKQLISSDGFFEDVEYMLSTGVKMKGVEYDYKDRSLSWTRIRDRLFHAE